MEGFQALLLPAIRRISDKLERATVASEVADYLGIDRTVVLGEFRRAPAGPPQGKARPASPPRPNVPLRERILLRSLLERAEVRATLLGRMSASEAARRFTIWPILEAIAAIEDCGGELSYPEIELRLDSSHHSLAEAAFFADNSEEVLSEEQAAAFARVLDADDRRLAVESLRSRLKQAERSGDGARAFQLMEELNRFESGNKR